MAIPMKRILAWTLCLISCQTSSDYISKSQYQQTRQVLQRKNYTEALKQYPDLHSQDFIPTLEREFISLLIGNVDTQAMVHWSQKIEDTKIISFSNEADRFFFKDFDEHYLPAEHEIIMFHLVTGLAFAQKNQLNKAKVEARRAAYYLPGALISDNSFDDPGLRMILASLWLMCDEWQQARANLRRAAKLNPEHYSWAQDIASKKSPPKQFILALRGVGPEVIRKPDHKDSKRWGLLFSFEEKEVALSYKTNRNSTLLDHPWSTQNWYLRHFNRDSIPRTMLDNVNYGARKAIGVTGAVILGIGVAIGAVTLLVGGIGIGAGLIIAGLATESGTLLDLATKVSYFVISVSIATASDVAEFGRREATQIYSTNSDASESYRFVRFLPSLIYAHASDTPSSEPGTIHGAKPLIHSERAQTQVMVFYMPK